MHPSFQRASGLTETIIAAAIEVHRNKGPGLIESVYEWCLIKEMELRGLACASQKSVVIDYKGFRREEPLRFDVLVEGCLLVEVKAVEKIHPIHNAQLLSYMKLLNIPLGLLINFRNESHRRRQPPHPAWCERMSRGLREETGGTDHCFSSLFPLLSPVEVIPFRP